MKRYLALIKNNLVQSIAVGDSEFITHVSPQYDFVVDITEFEKRPSVGESYYPDTESFIKNNEGIHEISVDNDQEHLQQGTEAGFEPFLISKYSVSYDNGMVRIGCKMYSAPGLLDALHRVLINREKGTVSYFIASEKGPAHGKFEITWDDTQKLYDVLKKVKFL